MPRCCGSRAVSLATPRKARLKFSKLISIASFLLMDEDRKAGFYSPKSTFYWTFAYKITRATIIDCPQKHRSTGEQNTGYKPMLCYITLAHPHSGCTAGTPGIALRARHLGKQGTEVIGQARLVSHRPMVAINTGYQPMLCYFVFRVLSELSDPSWELLS